MPEPTVEQAIDCAVAIRGWSREHATQVVRGMMSDLFWSPEAIVLGLRADFCCEYCGRDFLGSPDDFKLWERDHITRRVPKDDSLDNLALACLPCNFKFKCRWNPPDGTRAERIQAVKTYVRALRLEKNAEIQRIRSLLSRDRDGEPSRGAVESKDRSPL